MDFRITSIEEFKHRLGETSLRVKLEPVPDPRATQGGSQPLPSRYAIDAFVPYDSSEFCNLVIGQVLSFGPAPEKSFVVSNSTVYYKNAPYYTSSTCNDSGMKTDLDKTQSYVHSQVDTSKEEADLSDEIKRLEAQVMDECVEVVEKHKWHTDQTNKAVDAFVETVTPKKKKRRK
jgi:hypothetical protein